MDAQARSVGRPSLYHFFSRLSLRAKGVAVLALPVTALFVSLFSIFWVESLARDADLTLVRAYDTRAELLQLEVFLLDASRAARDRRDFTRTGLAIAQSLSHLETLAAADPPTSATLREVRAAVENEMRLLDSLRDQSDPAARGALEEQAKFALTHFQAGLGLVSQSQDLRLFRARYNRDVARQRLFRIVLGCAVLGPLGALLVHLLIAGRLVDRLDVVRENARRLAHGLPLEPLSIGSDEVASVDRQLQDAAVLLEVRERAILGSERRHRDLFDRAPVPYEETDTYGVIHRVNQAACNLLKCPSDRVLGRSAWDFLPPAGQESFRAAMLSRIATGSEAAPFECDYVLEDGSRITVEIRESLMHDENGGITGVCRSVQDVTERNLAAMAARKVSQFAMELALKNEQLAQALDAARSATEAKSRFLAGVSHELRTPLNGIIGFSEILYDGRVGPISEEHREIMGDILSSARHLLGLISGILDLSKVEAGKLEFHPESCSIAVLVEEVRDVIRPLAERKSIQVATNVPGSLQCVIDPSRFKQVLYNYLSNAVKFTPEDGCVHLRVEPEGESSFRLEVEDNGIGISETEIPLLFQDFQQLPYGRKAGQGTGLGLALTRRIVEAQGGSVGVHSAPGQGSVFSAVLPVLAPGSAALAAAKVY
jgi:PAS domain S-box-containing protein